MKKIIYIFILLLLQQITVAQGFRARCYAPNSLSHETKDVFEISSGNYVTLGISTDTIGNATRYLMRVTGLDAQGQVQWMKNYGNPKVQFLYSPFTTRTACKSGNHIYYTGCVKDSANKQIGILMKFDFSGNLLWQKFYRDSMDVIPQVVTTSVDGGFLITGLFQSWTSPDSPCLLIKTDANGNELWRKKLNKATPNASDGRAILQDSVTKKIVIGGYQYVGNQSSWNARDNLIVLDSLGTILVRNYFNDGACLDLIRTSDKKIVAVGTVAVDVGVTREMSYVLKFDINNPSNPIWRINNFGPLSIVNSFKNVVELPNGNLLIAGCIDSLADITNKVNVLSRFVWVSSAGQILKAKYYDYRADTNKDNIQNLVCLQATSDGGWMTSVRCQNPGKNSMFYVKYDANGCDSTTAYCATVGIEERDAKNAAIRLWPNPANDFVEIGAEGEFKATITDLSGKVLAQTRMSKIDVRDLKAGAYFIGITREGRRPETQKLIIIH